jgi:prepilin-type N-terminal cleavage/methylation domain-containing protein
MRATPSSPRFTFHVSRFTPRAFTLLELLTVIAIIALLAGLMAPVLRNFKPNVAASATRQLMDGVARARQLAISQRTTVYMVFVPTNFWVNPIFTNTWRQQDFNQAANLYDKQLIGYNYVSLHSVGDQPGTTNPRYLGPWQTLPEGTFIPWPKFIKNGPAPVMNLYSNNVIMLQVYGFQQTSKLPFPLADTAKGSQPKNPYVSLPYLAFDYLGRLTDDSQNIFPQNILIPLAKGSATFPHDPITKVATPGPVTLSEVPLGNATNAYTAVNIDWLTGRPRVERVELQ